MLYKLLGVYVTRLWGRNHLRVRRQGSRLLQVFGTPPLHHNGERNGLHRHHLTQGCLHDQRAHTR